MHNQLPPCLLPFGCFLQTFGPGHTRRQTIEKKKRPAAGNIIGMMKHRYIPTSTTNNNYLPDPFFFGVSPARGIAALLCVVARPIQLAVLAGTGRGNGL